jgi:hypothetical protein
MITDKAEVNQQAIFNTSVASATASNNSIFRDTADNRIKIKDNSGNVSPILGDIVYGLTPTTAGTWSVTPTDLTNITDLDFTTSCVQGNVYTGGSPDNQYGYIVIDLGEEHIIGTTLWKIWYDFTSGNVSWGQSRYLVEYSTDGINYTTIYTSGYINSSSPAVTEQTGVAAPYKARYLRITNHVNDAGAGGVDMTGHIKVYVLSVIKIT